MYSLHQLFSGKIEFTDAYSLDAALKELKEETGFRMHYFRVRWLNHNEKYNYNIYTIELDSKEKPK